MIYIISQMRYPPAHKDRTRQRIVRAAARRFRERGSEGVAIADLMHELRLTHGGFYRHFKGKEELFNEALVESFRQAEATMNAATAGASPGGKLEALIRTYLSEGHCDNRGEGCPVAALATELAHHRKSTRSTLGRALRDYVAGLAPFVPGDTPTERERRVLVLFAGMAGVLNVARATSDAALRRTILEAGRTFFLQAFCGRA
jgi:TetR/AcrR family transcriptional regulator, transcriptional repressor for nem operon